VTTSDSPPSTDSRPSAPPIDHPVTTAGSPNDVARFIDSIVENLPHMIFVKDAKELRFILFNKAGEELLGYSRAEMIGKNDHNLFPKEEADFFTAKDREVLEGRKLVDIPEEPIHTREKGERILHTKKIPILDENGTPRFLLGISEDVTERKITERRMRQAERLASIGALAAGIAHEINNPIGAILLYAQSAQLLEPSDDTARNRMLREIVEQSERCGRIVRSILQFAKQEATEKWLTDTNGAVIHACHIVEQDATARDAKIELDLSEGLAQITANPTELEQVFVNVLSNAVQSRDRGVRVTVRTLPIAGGVRVAVEDDGPGIAAEEQEFVFDPFYTSRKHEGGTGLGLSISRGIVESHGGTIEAQAREHGGTVVVIELPAADGSAAG
jgi:PAS domain S-box-containing protein